MFEANVSHFKCSYKLYGPGIGPIYHFRECLAYLYPTLDGNSWRRKAHCFPLWAGQLCVLPTGTRSLDWVKGECSALALSEGEVTSRVELPESEKPIHPYRVSINFMIELNQALRELLCALDLLWTWYLFSRGAVTNYHTPDGLKQQS